MFTRKSIGDRYVIAIIMAFTLLTGRVDADNTLYWNAGDVEGDFSAAGNWDPPESPNTNHYVFFDGGMPSAYFTADLTNTLMRVYNGAALTLNLAGHTYKLTASGTGSGSGLRVAPSGSAFVTMSNGLFLTESFDLLADGTLVLTGPGMIWTNNVALATANSIHAGATLRVEDGARVNLKDARVYGTLTLIDQDTRLECDIIYTDPSTRIVVSNDATLYASDVISVAGSSITVDNATVSKWSSAVRGDITICNNAEFEARYRTRLYGDAVVSVEGGADLNSLSYFEIHENATLTFRDAGTTATSTYVRLKGGVTGQSVMNVHTGAYVQTTHIYIADTIGQTAAVHVVGNGARLRNHSTTETVVGGDIGGSRGTGLLRIADGGELRIITRGLRILESGVLSINNGVLVFEQLVASNANRPVFSEGAVLDVTLNTHGTNAMIQTERTALLGNATFRLRLQEGFSSRIGEIFTLINAGGIDGTFQDLPEGAVIAIKQDQWLGPFMFQVSYTGGIGGNDFTLTTIAVPPSGTMFRFY